MLLWDIELGAPLPSDQITFASVLALMSTQKRGLILLRLELELPQQSMGKLPLPTLSQPKQLLVRTEEQPPLQRFQLGTFEFVLARPTIKFRTTTNKGELNELRL